MQKIAIIGLGYVGLPLARLFATKHHVIGFDIHLHAFDEYQNQSHGAWWQKAWLMVGLHNQGR